MATPEARPAAADRDDDLREVGHVLEQLEAERALAGDDVEVVERVHERQPFLLARPLLRGREALLERSPPPTCTVAPCPRAASALAIGASAGTKTSHGTPRAAAAAATPCAWLPAEAATTPPRSGPPPARQLRRRAADLEGAGALEVLRLQQHVAAGALGDRARREHRRAARDARDLGARPRCRCQSGIARMASISTSAPSGSDATPIVLRAGGASPK